MKDETLILLAAAGAALLYFTKKGAAGTPAVAPLSGSPFSQPAIAARAVTGTPDQSGLAQALANLAKGINSAISPGTGGPGSRAGAKPPPQTGASGGGPASSAALNEAALGASTEELMSGGTLGGGDVFQDFTPGGTFGTTDFGAGELAPYSDLTSTELSPAAQTDLGAGELAPFDLGSSDFTSSDYTGAGDFSGGDLSAVDFGGGSDASLDSTD